jgi:hypothetical protein
LQLADAARRFPKTEAAQDRGTRRDRRVLAVIAGAMIAARAYGFTVLAYRRAVMPERCVRPVSAPGRGFAAFVQTLQRRVER